MIEVAVAVVSGVFLLLAALGPPLLSQARRLKHVQTQVTNGHSTNLRDDIDAIRGEIVRGFGQVHERLNLLQTDLTWERRERIDLAERVEGQRVTLAKELETERIERAEKLEHR